MHISIKINDNLHIDQTIPKSWNDLPLRLQLICYSILLTDARGLFSAQELVHAKKIQLAMALLNINQQFIDAWKESCILEADGDREEGNLLFISQLDEVMKCTDFLFEKLNPAGDELITQYQIRLGLTRCPFPVLERKHKVTGKPVRYYAPADHLANMTIYEMATTFTLFEKFMNTREEQHAIRLLATMYRPRKPATPENKRSGYQGDVRLPLLHHESTVDKRAAHMAKLPEQVRHLIVFWFASCRQAIVQAYPVVFSGAPEGADGRRYGWSSVLLSLADGLVHLDAVAQQNHQNALTYLSYLEDQRRKLKLQKA